jgi:hypothetical protein
MSLIKKIDVKNHFSSRKRNGIHLYRPVSQPDATGFSGVPSEQAVKEAVSQASVGDLETPSTKTRRDSSEVLKLVESKSAQA